MSHNASNGAVHNSTRELKDMGDGSYEMSYTSKEPGVLTIEMFTGSDRLRADGGKEDEMLVVRKSGATPCNSAAVTASSSSAVVSQNLRSTLPIGKTEKLRVTLQQSHAGYTDARVRLTPLKNTQLKDVSGQKAAEFELNETGGYSLALFYNETNIEKSCALVDQFALKCNKEQGYAEQVCVHACTHGYRLWIQAHACMHARARMHKHTHAMHTRMHAHTHTRTRMGGRAQLV